MRYSSNPIEHAHSDKTAGKETCPSISSEESITLLCPQLLDFKLSNDFEASENLILYKNISNS